MQGNIARWLKKEGDKISPGEVLCEVETVRFSFILLPNIWQFILILAFCLPIKGYYIYLKTIPTLKDKSTVEMECMEEGYLAKIISGDGAEEIKVDEVCLCFIRAYLTVQQNIISKCSCVLGLCFI